MSYPFKVGDKVRLKDNHNGVGVVRGLFSSSVAIGVETPFGSSQFTVGVDDLELVPPVPFDPNQLRAGDEVTTGMGTATMPEDASKYGIDIGGAYKVWPILKVRRPTGYETIYEREPS